MSRDEFDDLTLAIFLVALAGFVDAVGFLILHGLFVSFMNGNTTKFAIRVGHFAWARAAPAGVIVGLCVVGRLIEKGAGTWHRPAILAFETVFLGLAAWVPLPALAAGALMTVAMGAQNGILHAAGRTKTTLTYVTGSLDNFGDKLADALTGEGPASAPWPDFALWAGMVVGGVAGAVTYGQLGFSALALPAVAAALLAAASAAGLARSPK